MQVEAIYNDGKLEFSQSIGLVRKRFKVKVEIPDEEIIVGNTQTIESALDHLLASRPDDQWLKRMKEIETRILSIPEDELPELTPKQLQYIDAFATRKER
ncbi:MAG: hypothetical protein DRH37_08595 [Deltaproteobacteria bacterium]|nr:MAG: hypothetical protein DRH37_08595 [Deltaproteobacteria bacterium]